MPVSDSVSGDLGLLLIASVWDKRQDDLNSAAFSDRTGDERFAAIDLGSLANAFDPKVISRNGSEIEANTVVGDDDRKVTVTTSLKRQKAYRGSHNRICKNFLLCTNANASLSRMRFTTDWLNILPVPQCNSRRLTMRVDLIPKVF